MKGVGLLLQAVSILEKEGFLDKKGVILHIVGEGAFRQSLEAQCNSLNLAKYVRFLGKRYPPEVYKFYKSCDIFLHTPYARETFGITLLEAMAAGKPLISTCVGGIPEFVKQGRNGILIKPDPHEIAEAIKLLALNHSLKEEIGKNNLADVIHYSWDKVIDKYIKFYKGLCHLN